MSKGIVYSFAFGIALIVTSLDCNAQLLVTPGVSAVGGDITALTSTTVNVKVDSGYTSYECLLVGSRANSDLSITPSNLTESVPWRCGDVVPTLAVGSGDQDSGDNRICFFGGYTTGSQLRATIASGVSGGEPARFTCEETTLYGSFNTFVNSFNFLEITNTSNGVAEVLVYTRDYSGRVVSEWDTISAYSRKDIDIHSLVGPNKYGWIALGHNMPSGSVTARLSQYRMTGSSMELSVSEELKTRARH